MLSIRADIDYRVNHINRNQHFFRVKRSSIYYMFEIILHKYKRKMKKGIPGKVRIQIILLSICMVALLFGCFHA